MTTVTKVTIAIGAVALLGVGLVALQKQTQPPGRQQGMMSMDDMMKQCREHCQATSASVDRTLATIEEARQSNDPAKMRAALEQIEKPLADMKQHMTMCTSMMGMMEKMGGMTAGQKQALAIAFTSRPDPPKTGENTFEATVKEPDGKPVTDADVSVRFYMAAMPSMNMPEMRNTVTLKHVTDGVYRGTGNVMMAGRWDVTVVVAKGGKELGSRKLTITAK